jgi:hypothetical protein
MFTIITSSRRLRMGLSRGVSPAVVWIARMLPSLLSPVRMLTHSGSVLDPPLTARRSRNRFLRSRLGNVKTPLSRLKAAAG